MEPKLLGFDIYGIIHTDGKCLVISINKSWNSPHAIKLGESKYQFPYRTDSGKAYYDIPTLRDGIRTYCQTTRILHNQLFRNASIEVALELCPINPPNYKYIDEKKIEAFFNDGFEKSMSFFKKQNIFGPISIFINLFNIKNCYLGETAIERDPLPPKINQDHIDLGSMVVRPGDTKKALEPILKLFYNVFGLSKINRVQI